MTGDSEIELDEETKKELMEQLARENPRLYGPKLVKVKGKYVMFVEYGTGPSPIKKKTNDKTEGLLFKKGIAPKRFVKRSVTKINSRMEHGDFNESTVLDIANALAEEIKRNYKRALEDSNAKVNVTVEEMK